jgi:uncharacterized protein YlxW (UPF0749 family)
VAFGFLLAGQLRLQMTPSSNRVERNAALVRSVRELEKTNDQERARIQGLRSQIDALEARLAGRSAAAKQLGDELSDLRAQAGLTDLRGPGVKVNLGSGNPTTGGEGASAYLVTFQDIQDVVNLLFDSGAEGVSVNARRITPISAFKGSADAVVIDQGPPLSSPFQVVAVGNRGDMEAALNDASTLGDLRNRQRRYGVQLSWSGDPDLTLHAYDGSFDPRYAHAT